MPQRKIKIPAPVRFNDPYTGNPLPGDDAELTFGLFLTKLFANPVWSDGIKPALAQRAIQSAYQSTSSGVIVLAEEDWAILADAVRTPRTMLMTSAGLQVQPGIGYAPQLASQLLPMYLAVIDAEQV